MLPATRVIAIDDDPKDLAGLTRALNQYGAACLPIHFTGETQNIPSCPYVRVIFADLHLGGGTPREHVQDFAMIGGLIENTIRPCGPYLIVLWTKYPDHANGLLDFLEDRLRNVPKPFAVHALDKSAYLDSSGSMEDAKPLVEAIKTLVEERPQVGALFNWEERVLGAAGDTISSIMGLAESVVDTTQDQEIEKLLANMAVAAAGSHVEEDRFRAVNEVLLPILADRLGAMRSRDADFHLWQNAFGKVNRGEKLSPEETARLNRLLHIATPSDDGIGTERGAVINLPEQFSNEAFVGAFGLCPQQAGKNEFLSKQITQGDPDLRWVLVQTQAACDYAQVRPGPLPFHLGLCIAATMARKNAKPPAALWRSPCFEFENQAHFLHVNARFQLSLVSDKVQQKPLFRLREPLLNDLVYHLHGYGARPGFISF